MTVVYKREEFKSSSGVDMFIEQYADSPSFVKFWRYGAVWVVNGVRYSHNYGKMLLSKPRKSRLIETY